MTYRYGCHALVMFGLWICPSWVMAYVVITCSVICSFPVNWDCRFHARGEMFNAKSHPCARTRLLRSRPTDQSASHGRPLLHLLDEPYCTVASLDMAILQPTASCPPGLLSLLRTLGTQLLCLSSSLSRRWRKPISCFVQERGRPAIPEAICEVRSGGNL